MKRPLNWMAAVGALTLAMLHAVAIPVFADVLVPPLKARVTDVAGTLTTDQRAALEAKLATFEERKGSQIAVLIVPTTQPEAIEQYSIRVAEQWKLGRKGVDDGVLLLVAKNDRKMRLEVGRGLEGAIPDAIAKRIVSDVIAPRFKEGDFYGGIIAGVDRILRAIEGEPLPAPKIQQTRVPGADLSGSAQQDAGIPDAWLQSRLDVGVITLFVILFGAIMVLSVFVAIMIYQLLRGVRGVSWGGDGGSWGGDGGSSDSGGFSGGGGDFGGGGASGDW